MKYKICVVIIGFSCTLWVKAVFQVYTCKSVK